MMVSLSMEEENYVRMGLLLTGISPRAARALFDYEFHPSCLCASLKKELNKLNDLKKKRVINQSQWNLLFPRFPDVPKSDTFDVTLIIALLRKLTDLNPPHGGFDKLPAAIETTPGSDLARIKYYRNYLAHLKNAVVENNDFNTFWEDISQAVGRLGGNSMKQECDLLKTKTLDQTNKEIIMDIKYSHKEIEQLKKSFGCLKRSQEEDKRTVKRLKTSHKNVLSENKKVKKKLQTLQHEMTEITAEQNEVIPKNIREQINKQIELWEKEDLMFVSTRASDYVIKCLMKNCCVTLTGPAGVGKSFTGRHAALFLQEKEYRIIPVNSPTDIRDYYQPDKRTVFIVDDICGHFTANQQQIENWEQLLPVIRIIVKDNCCKIILSCRLQVYKDDNFSILSLFKSCECNLISNELCLTSVEKRDIAHMHIGTNSKNLSVKAIRCEFFPLLCYLYPKQEGTKTDLNEFFEHPFNTYKTEVDNLVKHSKHKVCSLALCVISNNRLDDKWFQGKVLSTQRQFIEDTCNACCLNRSTSKTELKEALDTLEGTFICKENGIYRILHDKLFDFLALRFGRKMIECFIDHCDENLLEERFVWHNSSHNKTSNTEFIIEIPDNYLEAYLKRLINDWSNGMVRFVFDKKDMKESYFRERFLQFLLQLDKSKQITLINTKDTRRNICKSGGYPLTRACEHGYTDIVTWILDNDVDVDQCRDDGATGLYIACNEGHTAILNMLLEKNCNVDLCDNNGFTPMINSCRNNNISIVKLLLQYKPNINAQAHDGSTALYFSILYGNVEMTQLLLVHQADCNISIYSKDHLRDIHTNHATKSLSIHIWNTSLDREKNEIINILVSNTSTVIADYVSRRRVETIPKTSGRKNRTSYSISKSAYYALDVVAGSSPFHIACFMGMTDVVRCLLDHKANINMTKEDGTTPLSYACELGHTDIVQILLEKNAYVDTCDTDGLTPVIKACMNNHTSTVQLLIKYKPDINARTFDGTKALFFSALHGNLEITKLLLENNADCNNCIDRKQLFTKSLSDNSKETSCKQNRDFFEYLVNCSSTNVTQFVIKDSTYVFGIFAGSSPLHIACSYGRLDIVRSLIENKANINKANYCGSTPLADACELGHTDIVKMLLDQNANMESCDNFGLTPLIKSCLNNHTSTVKLFIKHKCDINARACDGGNALFFSALNGNLEITQLLLQCNADCNICFHSKDRIIKTFCNHAFLKEKKYEIFNSLVNNQSTNAAKNVRNKSGIQIYPGTEYKQSVEYTFDVVAGSSPLHIACFMGWANVVCCLLEHKASINMTKEDGTTPLSYACEVGHEDIVRILLEKNANVDICDNFGLTPLIKACLNEKISTIQVLMKHKPDVNARACDGGNALFFSALNGNKDITHILLQNNADCNICIYSKECMIRTFENHTRKSFQQEKQDLFDRLKENSSSFVQQHVTRKSLYQSLEKTVDYIFDVVAGSSPLHIACFMGWTDVVRCLLGHKANVHMTKEDGTTPLSYACEVGHADIVQILLEEKASVNMCDNDGFTPLIKSCMKNNTSVVQLLIKHNSDVNAKALHGISALFFSSISGKLEILQLLLKNGADCNICSDSKEFIKDALTNHKKKTLKQIKKEIFDIVNNLLLIANDNDIENSVVNASKKLFNADSEESSDDNSDESTDYDSDESAGNDSKETAEYDRKKAVDYDSKRTAGYDSKEAADYDSKKTAEYESKEAVDYDSKKAVEYDNKEALDNYNEKAVNYDSKEAVDYDNKEAVDYDSKKTVDYYSQEAIDRDRQEPVNYDSQDAVDYDNQEAVDRVFGLVTSSSPLHIACFVGRKDAIHCLLEHKANINMAKEDGTTPLFYACEVGHEDNVRLLLDRGADTQICRLDGKSPFDIATDNGHESVVTMLRKQSEAQHKISI